MAIEDVDIKEENIAKFNKGKILKELLTDHTRRQMLRGQKGHEEDEAYIIWATDDYFNSYEEKEGDAEKGITKESYAFDKPISPELILGEHEYTITPRIAKSKTEQERRTKDKAEVFTPSWVCNAQNNLIDEAWFGRKNVFNEEIVREDGTHWWKTTEGKIEFSDKKGKTWKDYVRDTRMEITCGEAPYLVSRYDTTSGEIIPVKNRIGLLDRKLRVVSENTEEVGEWLDMAYYAYQNTYGYEWQGDNLLLARESLFYTFIDYFKEKFGKMPNARSLQAVAYIISWNIWQMDGLKYVIPCTCHDVVTKVDGIQLELFGNTTEEVKEIRKPCEGCAKDLPGCHNGIYCKIRDWPKFKENNPKCDIEFYKLLYFKQ